MEGLRGGGNWGRELEVGGQWLVSRGLGEDDSLGSHVVVGVVGSKPENY